MITEFFALTFIGLMMIISPGPDFAVIVKNSLAYGRQSGIFSSMGVAVANLCHVTINLLGIGIIISQSVVAFTVMKILGAIYLLSIGFKSLLAKPESKESESPSLSLSRAQQDLQSRALQSDKAMLNNPLSFQGKKFTKRRSFLSGFLTSVLNPKACLFFLSFFSVILSADTPFLIQLSYGLWLSFLALIWFTLVAIFFTNQILAHRLKACKHWLERVTGGLLMLFGVKLLTTELS